MNDADIERLRWAAFDLIRGGREVTADVLAANLGASAAEVERELSEQAAIGRVELDEHARVVGSNGVTSLATQHSFTVADVPVHTWCALDAIGIPAASGDDAVVHTTCGSCGTPITVRIVGGNLSEQTDIVLWLPTAACKNVRDEFCPEANLFCSRQHLKQWQAESRRSNGRVLTVREAVVLGKRTWDRENDVWAGIEAIHPDALEASIVTCSCCGEERDRLVALRCHDDVKICPTCIGWLRSKTSTPDVTPILAVRDMPQAIAFYQAAGFAIREYEPGGGYAFVHYEDESVFDLDLAEHPVDPPTNSGCYMIVADVDEWHARLRSAGLPVTDLADEPWGMREFKLTDPNGNYVRIGRSQG